MTEEMDNRYIEDSPEDSPIMNGYLMAQAMLDRFVAINYETATDAALLHTGDKGIDAGHIKQQVVDIIRNNPPLQSVPLYFHDGRANYLWYSDFYDDAGKEVFKAYKQFASTLPKVTLVSYKTELAKIDLPYFKELVDLISLEKLYTEAEHRLAAVGRKSAPEKVASIDIVEQSTEGTAVDVLQQASTAKKTKKTRTQVKLSYNPILNDKQYQLLEECVNEINLFRRPVAATELKSLFAGKLSEPLQATNQKSLTYLLDLLVEAKYIKPTWITIAEKNKDFISFLRGKNAERYGDGPHYITWQQFSNCRNRNNKEYVEGLPTIEETIEKMQECGK